MGMKSTVMTKSALTAALAESCEVKRGVISTALSTLASIATQEAKKNGKFVIPGVVMIKTRQKKATKAGKREIFGKVVMVKAKPAKTIVKAFPAKALKDEFCGPPGLRRAPRRGFVCAPPVPPLAARPCL